MLNLLVLLHTYSSPPHPSMPPKLIPTRTSPIQRVLILIHSAPATASIAVPRRPFTIWLVNPIVVGTAVQLIWKVIVVVIAMSRRVAADQWLTSDGSATVCWSTFDIAMKPNGQRHPLTVCHEPKPVGTLMMEIGSAVYPGDWTVRRGCDSGSVAEYVLRGCSRARGNSEGLQGGCIGGSCCDVVVSVVLGVRRVGCVGWISDQGACKWPGLYKQGGSEVACPGKCQMAG